MLFFKIFIFRLLCLFTSRENNNFFFKFGKAIKVHQYGYPMKGQVTWHELGRAWTGWTGTGQVRWG
jgi:hypothetical protein